MIAVNEIHNGDCIALMKEIPDESIDLVLTSPPYENIREYKGFTFDFEATAREIQRILKKGGVCVWVVNDQVIDGSESGTSFKQALFFKDLGLKLHDTMIYDKGSVVFPDSNRYHGCFEYMFVFSKGKPKTFNPIADRKNQTLRVGKVSTYRQEDGSLKAKLSADSKEMGWRFNIWRIKPGYMCSTADVEAFEHPAIFPEKLAQDHIVSWTNKGDLVLDPFNGSGTTTKCAKYLNRAFIGIDISERYCEIARNRLRQGMLI